MVSRISRTKDRVVELLVDFPFATSAQIRGIAEAVDAIPDQETQDAEILRLAAELPVDSGNSPFVS